MVLWTITLIMTVKYVTLVIRADNDGEGGILAPLALLPPQERPFRSWPQRLFLVLERNQADRTEVFHLPPMRTVVMGPELET